MRLSGSDCDRIVGFGLLFAAATLVAGCDGTAECQLDIDCPGVLVCRSGKCVERPTCPDVACREGEACVNRRCFSMDCPEKACGPIQVCLDDACVDQGCVDVSCEPGRICRDGVCLGALAGPVSLAAGIEVLQSENYSVELFVAPECPVGGQSSGAHRVELGPAAVLRTLP